MDPKRTNPTSPLSNGRPEPPSHRSQAPSGHSEATQDPKSSHYCRTRRTQQAHEEGEELTRKSAYTSKQQNPSGYGSNGTNDTASNDSEESAEPPTHRQH